MHLQNHISRATQRSGPTSVWRREEQKRKRRAYWVKVLRSSVITIVELVLCLACAIIAILDETNRKVPRIISCLFLGITVIDLASWINLRPITYHSWLMVCTGGFLMFMEYMASFCFGHYIDIAGLFFGVITSITFLVNLVLLLRRFRRYPYAYWTPVYLYHLTDAGTGTYGEKLPPYEDRPLCYCGASQGEQCRCDVRLPKPEGCRCEECGALLPGGDGKTCSCGVQVNINKPYTQPHRQSSTKLATVPDATDSDDHPQSPFLYEEKMAPRRCNSHCRNKRSVRASVTSAPKSKLTGTERPAKHEIANYDHPQPIPQRYSESMVYEDSVMINAEVPTSTHHRQESLTKNPTAYRMDETSKEPQSLKAPVMKSYEQEPKPWIGVPRTSVLKKFCAEERQKKSAVYPAWECSKKTGTHPNCERLFGTNKGLKNVSTETRPESEPAYATDRHNECCSCDSEATVTVKKARQER